MTESGTRYTGPRKWNWPTIALVAALHVGVFVFLLHTFAPDLTRSAVNSVESALTVIVTAPEDLPETADVDEPDAGAEGAAGEEAVAREVVAPEPAVRRPDPPPAPRASSTGNANQSGARDEGSGTGAGDGGEGTGGGGAGSGAGGVNLARGPSVRSGSINAARDFPVPEGGREVRYGTSITAAFTVTPDGRATNCSIVRPGPDPQANAILCQLIASKIRFNPALNRAGEPIAARYGWRQDFRGR